jgi:hypothetical protein
MRIPLIVAVLIALASGHALAGPPNTVAVAVDTDHLDPKLAAEVQDGMVAHVLTGLGQVMSTLSATNLDLAIQIRVQPNRANKKTSRRAKQDYVISMIIARALPSREAWTDKTECQGCGAGEIKHAASLLASLLAEHIDIYKAPPARSPEVATPVAAAPTPPTPIPTPSPAPVAPHPATHSLLHAKPVPTSHAPTYLWVAALVGGGLAMGTGIYLLHLDGEGTCDSPATGGLCARRYRTEGLGIGLIAGGGLAALGGLAGLLFLSPGGTSAPVALNISPSSILVSGAF